MAKANLINDEVFHHESGLSVPARSSSGFEMRQGPPGSKLKA